jgi:hypothetical protein
MNLRLNRFISLQLAALAVAAFFTTTCTGSSRADTAVPFRGQLQGVEMATGLEFPLLFVDVTATGNASHLGRFGMTYEITVNLVTHDTSGFAVFTAANGDQLFTDVVGHGTSNGDDTADSVVEIHTIAGGTGRFAEATGSFIRTYLLDLVTGADAGSFAGTLVLH